MTNCKANPTMGLDDKRAEKFNKTYMEKVRTYRLSSSPTFSDFSNFLGVFLLFSYFFFSENSYFSYLFAIKCQNNFSYQQKLGLHESAPSTLQLLGA